MNDLLFGIIVVIAWETGKYIGGVFGEYWYPLEDISRPCPHGEDWDNCPDCNH